ncbi:MAG: MFS transporter [Hydrococcus sp. Prado102]|jgi:MFS family permease|nr:MFS transporter [Hydrococcus sp. Prado102]
MGQHQKVTVARVFIFIWFGQLISLIGSGLTSFALGVWVYQRTGSVTQFALISLFTALPLIAISPVAGAIVDRSDRRWIMILSNAGAAINTLAIALLLATNRLDVWHVYLTVVLKSTFSAFQWPAYTASTTLLVPKQYLDRASGLIQLGRAGSQLVSPVLGGLLLVSIQLQGIVLLDFLSFLFALVTLLGVRFPKAKTVIAPKKGKGSLLQGTVYGWRYLTARPGLLGLMIFFAAINFLVGVVEVLVTPMVLSFASAATLGTILSFGGIGMLAGSLLVSMGKGFDRRIRVLFCFMLSSGLCIAIAGLRPSIPLFALATFLFFLGLPPINVSHQVILQRKVVPDLQGRVFSINAAIAGASLTLGYAIAGPLSDRVFEPLMAVNGPLAGSLGQLIGVGEGRGIGLMFVVMGMLTMLATVLAYQYRPLRLVEKELPDVITDEAAAKDYRNLIGVLLTYPHKAAEIWKNNQTLIDADLLQMMEQVAIQMYENGSQKAAALLREQSEQLRRGLVDLTNILERDTEERLAIESTSQWVLEKELSKTGAYRNLIGVLLTYPHKTTEILEANQELVDAGLVHMMERMATNMSRNGFHEAAAFLREVSEQLKQAFVSTRTKFKLRG